MKKKLGKQKSSGQTGKSQQDKKPGRRRIRVEAAGHLHYLDTAPADAIVRIESIPLLFSPSLSDKFVHGAIAHDTWAHAGIGLRDVTDGHVRHLRFAAGKIQFELVAERRVRQWEFIGRIYKNDKVAHDFVLVIGSRRLLPNTGGFFTWSSDRVTRRVRLVSHHETIIFESIVW